MPSTVPVTLGLAPSFGFGDRLGLASPGHLASLVAEGGGTDGIKGIIAQQSIREMSRTNRTPTDVMSAAVQAIEAAGFDDEWGADADHLKTEQDVDYTADAGFTFFTIDPSDHVDEQADDYGEAELELKFEEIEDFAPWVGRYLDQSVDVENGLSIHFDATTVKRAAVKYGKAIQHAIDLGNYIVAAGTKRGRAVEIELSVDETPQPTTLAEHYIIADQMREAGIKLVSLAPRYVGEFEKGVDYKGDLGAFEASLADHAAIARQLGPYKLSLHSGSDKLSIYTAFGRITRGLLHVKTAGTSYLEALRVVARHDEPLFRQIVEFSRSRYDVDKATYHVSATVAGCPAAAEVSSLDELEKLYLEKWEDVATGKGFTAPGRQILHCTFGSVMTDATLGDAVRGVLEAHPDTHQAILADHFGKHLAALVTGVEQARATA